MKILHSLLAGSLFLLASTVGHAQPDTAKITQKALLFADSLVKTDAYETWYGYAELCPASVIKFYGGAAGYIDHVKTLRKRFVSELAEDAPEVKMQTLQTMDNQWQCVIRMSRYFHREGKKYHLVTSFIAQSKDDGETWRLFDVSYNKVANIIYLFPEIFGDLAIQDATALSEEQELAEQQKAAAELAAKQKAADAKAKKAVAKKK